MKDYRNPFKFRSSEQQDQQGLIRFLRTFGADVLDLLPEDLWELPLVIRSAPGGGKTSLLRTFTVEAIEAISSGAEEMDELGQRLEDLRAVEGGRPSVLGAIVSLDKGYRDLIDLGLADEVGKRLFNRLIDARVVRAICQASMNYFTLNSVEELDELTFEPTLLGDESLKRLGGPNARSLWDWARRAEVEIHDLMDSVLPISLESIGGHGELYSVRALTGATLVFRGVSHSLKPLVMFDDGQELHYEQRGRLIETLTDRTLATPRWWYTERFSALAPDEVIGDGELGRSYHVLPLEYRARKMGGTIRNGKRIRPFESMLIDVANKRARGPLVDYADEAHTTFTELLEMETSGSLDDVCRDADIIPAVKQRVLDLAKGRARYDQWIEQAESYSGYHGAVRWRELEIVVSRDRERPQLELLDLVLDDADLKSQSDAAIRDSASLFLRSEFKIPYYYGSQRVSRLASQNIEQYLVTCGDLFEEILAHVTLRRRLALSPGDQDRIIRATSKSVWQVIPQRRSYGRDIQHLLLQIGKLCRTETYRPTAPYAPGVTGTALSMRDRERLLDPNVRKSIPGAEELYRTLASAIGHNYISAELDRSVKNNRWMVLYLNRMLCAHFDLPIGYGGFKEKSLESMSEWMATKSASDPRGVDVPALFGAQ